MEVAQDRRSNTYRSAFHGDDEREPDSEKSSQTVIQSDFWHVTEGGKVRNRPNHKNCRDRPDCAKPQCSLALNRSLDPRRQRISAEPGTDNGANRSASHANQQIRPHRAKNAACFAHDNPNLQSRREANFIL